jgi:hypothetical protein
VVSLSPPLVAGRNWHSVARTEWAVFVVCLPGTWLRIDAAGIVARATVLLYNGRAIILTAPRGTAAKLTPGCIFHHVVVA